jgi:hypothetical protein
LEPAFARIETWVACLEDLPAACLCAEEEDTVFDPETLAVAHVDEVSGLRWRRSCTAFPVLPQSIDRMTVEVDAQVAARHSSSTWCVAAVAASCSGFGRTWDSPIAWSLSETALAAERRRRYCERQCLSDRRDHRVEEVVLSRHNSETLGGHSLPCSIKR